MSLVQLARNFYLAERLGGVFYDKFAANVDNGDVAGAFVGFAGHEHEHARWYAEWLTARGHEVPSTTALELTVIPGLRLATAPQPLALKLRTFALTELAAETHLRHLVKRVRDPELRAIIEKTIPFEHAHAVWYQKEGRSMLRRSDR
jgi:rubrerythrin